MIVSFKAATTRNIRRARREKRARSGKNMDRSRKDTRPLASMKSTNLMSSRRNRSSSMKMAMKGRSAIFLVL